MSSYYYWQELADRWTARCPKCGQKMDHRISPENPTCSNQDCEAYGKTLHAIWFPKKLHSIPFTKECK